MQEGDATYKSREEIEKKKSMRETTLPFDRA